MLVCFFIHFFRIFQYKRLFMCANLKTHEYLNFYCVNLMGRRKKLCCGNLKALNPIWPGGGGQNGPLRAFAKYLKNGVANLCKTS